MLNHLACIMDGNRRWAQTRGFMPWYGHKEGVDAAYRVIDFCLQEKIKHLSLFTFAIQNFKRSPEEIEHLFAMMLEYADEILKVMQEKDVRVQFVGDRHLFPAKIIHTCEYIEEKTSTATTLHLHLFFCYGGQEEIVATTKKIAQLVAQGTITPDMITPSLIEKSLWTAGIPSPDLVIRTGNVHRISNFMLYQAAYAELFFVDCMWPDISHVHLKQATSYFESCKRNFGT